MAVQLVDKLLEVTQGRFCKFKFQLLGATSLLIATKYEHTFPISIYRIAYLCGESVSINDILDMEADILSQLQFNLKQVTSYHILQFWNRISQELQHESQTCKKPHF